MKPRYAVVNEYRRDKFEKMWQMPYGYGKCFVSFNPQEAITYLNSLAQTQGEDQVSTMIVEKISEEGRELYYRI